MNTTATFDDFNEKDDAKRKKAAPATQTPFGARMSERAENATRPLFGPKPTAANRATQTVHGQSAQKLGEGDASASTLKDKGIARTAAMIEMILELLRKFFTKILGALKLIDTGTYTEESAKKETELESSSKETQTSPTNASAFLDENVAQNLNLQRNAANNEVFATPEEEGEILSEEDKQRLEELMKTRLEEGNFNIEGVMKDMGVDVEDHTVQQMMAEQDNEIAKNLELLMGRSFAPEATFTKDDEQALSHLFDQSLRDGPVDLLDHVGMNPNKEVAHLLNTLGPEVNGALSGKLNEDVALEQVGLELIDESEVVKEALVEELAQYVSANFEAFNSNDDGMSTMIAQEIVNHLPRLDSTALTEEELAQVGAFLCTEHGDTLRGLCTTRACQAQFAQQNPELAHRLNAHYAQIIEDNKQRELQQENASNQQTTRDV